MRLFLAVDRRQRGESVPLVAEEIGKMLDMQIAEHLRKNLRDDQAILKRVTRPRRRLRPVGDNPPLAVRRTGQINRVLMQPGAAGRFDAATGPKITVLTIDQRGRQQAIGKQFLFAIKVGQHGV